MEVETKPTTEEAGLRAKLERAELIMRGIHASECEFKEGGMLCDCMYKSVRDALNEALRRLSQRDDFRSWLESFQQPPHAGTDYIHWLNPKEVLEKFDAKRVSTIGRTSLGEPHGKTRSISRRITHV